MLPRSLSLFLMLLAATAGAQTDAPIADDSVDATRISEVRVEGNRRVEVEAVTRALRQKVGDAFDATKTGDDIKALWALKYFSDVQLLVQRTPKGVAYVVRLTEKPAIRLVSLQGNEELSKDDFKDTLDLKSYSILDVAAIQRNAKKLTDKYIEKGFFLAEVTWKLEPVGDTGQETDVVFVINERAKVMVREINFVGAQQVAPEDLKAVMATREGTWLSPITSEGTYREELFQRDLQVIQSAYYDRGFVNVRVDKPVVSLSPDKRYISISIRVEEGESFRIGKLDFSGDLIVDKRLLRLKMLSAEGDLFNRSLLARDIQSISDVYYDEGYAYANITPATGVNPTERTIDLTFDVRKGAQVTIERIDIVGNTKTRDKAIRRQLRVYEGELFSGTNMRRSKEKVTALGFFETVEVTHKPGSDDTHVVVNVEVKERSTGTFQVGLGFSNVESFIFTAQVAQQNFLGWGQSVSASAQLSGLRSFFQLSYVDPYFLDTNFIFSLDAYRTQLDYFGFVRDSWGGGANFGYYLIADEMSLSLGYTRELVTVEPGRDFTSQVSLFGQFRSGTSSLVRLSWVWDKRNNRIYPSQGWYSSLTGEFGPPAFGGSYLFNRYSLNQRVYFPLPLAGAVFKMQLQAGHIQQLDALNALPSSELFFLGGIGSIRGYPLRSVTPTTLVGAYTAPDVAVRTFGIGGDKQVVFNAEIEFPIIEKVGIRGVLFYDVGNVFAKDANLFEDKTYPWLPLGMFHSVGFGVRWLSPIGPLRFEWGIPLTKRPGDQSIQFEFTIGNSF